MSRTKQGSSDWYKQDGTTEETRIGICPLAFAWAKSGTASYVEISGMEIVFGELGQLVKQELAVFKVRAKVDSGTDWDVQLYDLTGAAELAVLNFTETALTNKSVTFSLPSVTKTVELMYRKNVGSSNKVLTISSALFTWAITP